MEYEDLTEEQKASVKEKMIFQNEINRNEGIEIWTSEKDFFETIKDLEEYEEV